MQACIHTYILTYIIPPYMYTNIHPYILSYINPEIQLRQTDSQTDRQTDRPADIQTVRQIESRHIADR